MALSGDIIRTPGLKLENDIFVTNLGLVSNDETEHRICDVYQAIDCSVDEVIHLIGYPKSDIESLTTDGILRATDEVNSQLKQLLPRVPDSYLIQEDNRLYGVTIDSQNEAKIVGLIDCVIPSEQTNGRNNTVIIEKDGNWKTCSSHEFDLHKMVSAGALFGIVSNGGFLFLQTKVCAPEDLPQLVLIQGKGYFLIEDAKVDWIRLKIGLRIGQIESRVTTLEPNECIVSRRGGCVRNGDLFELFGSSNAIVNFSALKDLMISMKTIGLGKEIEEEDQEIDFKVQKEYESEGDSVVKNITKSIETTLEANEEFNEDVCEELNRMEIEEHEEELNREKEDPEEEASEELESETDLKEDSSEGSNSEDMDSEESNSEEELE